MDSPAKRTDSQTSVTSVGDNFSTHSYSSNEDASSFNSQGSGYQDQAMLYSSRFENKCGLSEDLKFLASMPELCDVTFLVGEKKEPVCAVKAILAARSRVFHRMLFLPSPNSPNKKKGGSGDLKLASLKMFSRSRESLNNLPLQNCNSKNTTIVIKDFDADVFRQLVEYIHTGCVTLQARTLLGLMNAADHYGLEELRRACIGFMHCCINIDTVCALLSSAEIYIHYKVTKTFVQKVLEFVDEHGDEVLNLPAFATLPEHVARLVLAREELQAEELSKFRAALSWSKRHCNKNPNTSLKDAMMPFVDRISFHHIPALTLMKEIRASGAVADQKIMTALAFQADPTSVDTSVLNSGNAVRVLKNSLLTLNIRNPPTGGEREETTCCSAETLASGGSERTEGSGASANGNSDDSETHEK